MPAFTQHGCFPQPTDTSISLWRHMDFTRFVSMLSSHAIYFPRADKLGDPFEGSVPRVNLKVREKEWAGATPEAIEQHVATAKYMLEWIFISCWHMNEHESAAMWTIHGRGHESVAIRTSYQRLVDVLPDMVFIGMVSYIDYDSVPVPEGNFFYPFMHKRISFEFEREVRAVEQAPIPGDEVGLTLDLHNPHVGIMHEVELDQLIEAIYVAPYSQPWFRELVENVARTYGITAPVLSSGMDGEPVY